MFYMKNVHLPIRLSCFILIICNSVTFSQTSESKHKPQRSNEFEKPSIRKTYLGETDGQKIYQYTLRNSKGMIVKVINYGATITDIITADRHGTMSSVVLGFDTLASYTRPGSPLLGSVVGRVANRISNKSFTLDGKEYILTSNIHGGLRGFHKRIWRSEEVPGSKEVSVKLTYLSIDGEEGFPGNLTTNVLYTLTNQNELKITYTATTDKATPVVLTNHSYFNLSGGKEDKVLNTELCIAADKYLEATKDKMPTGNFLAVKGTAYDFNTPRKIGQRIAETTDGSGYDHVYVLRKATGKLALIATAYEPVSGMVLEVRTTEPGVVFYTGNNLSSTIIGRDGKPFTKHGGFCLETQHFPDSPNHPNFPSTILRPGETFRSQTVFKFSVRK